MSRILPLLRLSSRQFSTIRNAPKTGNSLLKQPSKLRQVAKRLQSDWVKPISTTEVILGIVIVGGGFSIWGFYLTKLMLDRMEEYEKRTIPNPISPEEYRRFKADLAAKQAEEDEDDDDEGEQAISEDFSQIEEIVEETFEEVTSSKDTVIFIDPPK